ncbi:MAG: hypothetical protein RL030_1302 [Pseudomonadota bacterium]|jgi:nucleoside transporter
MPTSLRFRLSLLMFLQYFMFGAWLVTLGVYMSKTLGFDDIIGTAYGMQGFATLVATLLVGGLADRYFQAQKVLGILALLSGATLFLLATVDHSRPLFLACLSLHFMVFVPTIPLGSAIVLHCVTDRAGQFPSVRVFGTLGWIFAGLLIGSLPGAAFTSLPLKLGGTVGLLLGLYAFTLPAVPPSPARGPVPWRELTGIDMVLRLRERDFALFIAGVMLMNVPLAFYNTYFNNFLVEAGVSLDFLGRRFEPAAIQTLGQASELVFLLLLPFFLLRHGVKGVLVVGMLSWALRYALFAWGAVEPASLFPLVIIGVLLHGVCYDFFFVAGQLYVDERFEASARSRAQAFLVMINMGIGVILASNLANAVYAAHTESATQHRWAGIWAWPAGLALVAGLAFASFFRLRRPAGVGSGIATG